MKFKSIILLNTLYLLLLLSSCSTSKTIRFQSELNSGLNEYLSHVNYQPVFQKNDIIEVKLITNNEEFLNLFETAIDNTFKSQVTYTSGASSSRGFVVDQDGSINIPYVGKITAHNKTREEVTSEITSKLSFYITESVVQLKILNYKITVLGDVKNPGTFNIPNEKITFIEALGIAGDVNVTANLKGVKLLREVNDSLVQKNINLNSDDVFYSDNFFLKQNDVIYIPPNKAKSATAQYSPVYIPLLTSLSLLLTTINLIFSK